MKNQPGSMKNHEKQTMENPFGTMKTIKTHLEPWKTNLELIQTGLTTLFKDFCNNTSVFQ